MTRSTAFRILLSSSLFTLLASASPVNADSSHARVIRLSLVQGDVRFTREAHGDPLADSKAVWETAQANLPIRQGYVVATDSGRAEVEFENGAMAFLDDNSVLDFYDLSLDDGARITRLVLRQGSASFYVNPTSDDYFSVTGGDFTVEAAGKGSFRINNFDDGSNVNVLSGRISVLHKKESTPLSKGQSLSMKAGEDSPAIARAPVDDDFDRWVSGLIDTVSHATNASAQYTASPYYLTGFGDLYTYGSWFDCGGFGLGWRPFGAGFGWYPFTAGQWLYDASFGWTFASSAPWGWAPYHYGGWLFDASCGGWFYSPPLGYGYGGSGYVPGRRPRPIVHPPRPVFHASTAVFVRQNGKLGIVPMNPLDKSGKTPLNLGHGVFSVQGGSHLLESSPAGGPKWETVKSPPHDAMNSGLAPSTAPTRISRTLIEANGGTRVVSLGENSTIVYDPHAHRFVNTNAEPRSATNTGKSTEAAKGSSLRASNGGPEGRQVNPSAAPSVPRATAPPSRSIPNPPAAHNSSGGGGSRGGGAEYAGGAASRGSSGAASAGASHASSAPASSGGGGGRPH